MVLSFAANGLDWPMRYITLLREPENSPFHEIMPNLSGLFEGVRYAGALEITGLIVIAVAVWNASRLRNPQWGLAAALAGGVFAAPHVYMADGALLVPAGLLLWRRGMGSWTRMLCAYLFTPIPWVLLMVGSGGFARIGLCALVARLGFSGIERCWGAGLEGVGLMLVFGCAWRLW
jgi:hypothetical protein